MKPSSRLITWNSWFQNFTAKKLYSEKSLRSGKRQNRTYDHVPTSALFFGQQVRRSHLRLTQLLFQQVHSVKNAQITKAHILNCSAFMENESCCVKIPLAPLNKTCSTSRTECH